MNNIIGLLIYCILYAILNVTGAAIIKQRIVGKTLIRFSDWLNFLLQIPVFFAFFLIFLSALTMFKALSSGSFSAAIPISTGVNFILTISVGYFLFKDHITFKSILGCVLIISGIIIISLNQIDHAK